MKLIDFLVCCKKLVDENPDALQMEMFAEHGASGVLDEISNPFVEPISRWTDNVNSEMPIEEYLPRNYKYDSVIRVYTGN
jgi:hypothetical protein